MSGKRKRIFINGNVITLENDGESGEARAQAVGSAGNTIAIVGSNEEVKNWGKEDCEVIDLQGATVVPGLIDSHSHITAGAEWAAHINCSTVTCDNIADVLAKITTQAGEKAVGDWVLGFGYDDTGMPEMRHLNRHDLDSVSTEHPIFISHVSGHLAYLNTKGLEIIGIDNDTEDPVGGEIVRDDDGIATGLLLETAGFMAREKIPKPNKEEFKELFTKMIANYNSHGLTSTHDGGIGFTDAVEFFSICQELIAADAMNIRIYGAVRAVIYPDYDDIGVAKGFGNEFVKIGGIKFFQDGSIQGLTGALLEDYANKPGHRGGGPLEGLIYPQEEFNDLIMKHHKAGDHIVVHANGDGAIESVLNAIELAQKEHPREDPRHMLIHAQMSHNKHIQQMIDLGVIPSYFINHVYYWGDRHRDIFLGEERAKRMEPLQTSLDMGLKFSVHSDFPITPIDPLFSIHTCVNRHTRSGKVLGEAECISALEALKTFTTYAALCSFEEDIKGSIEVGKLADLTVLAEDILEVDPTTIKDIKVLRTVVGGKTVFEA